jgi:nitrogen regulatory protein PII
MESEMKRIEATITPSNLDAFKEVAFELGISEFDIVQVYRSIRAPDEERRMVYRGREFIADVTPRLRTEFVVFDDDVQITLDQLYRLVHPESVSVFKLDQMHRSAEGHVSSAPPPGRATNPATLGSMGHVIGFVPQNGNGRH